MKHLLLLLICICAVKSHAQLRVEGTYLGTDIYVQNPSNNANDGYCVDSVIVNGIEYKVEFESNAFQIKLSELGLQIDDPIDITIYHKSDCTPKILNQLHQYTSGNFSFDNIEMNGHTLKWAANNNVPGQFEIQVYRWNKWITIDTLNRKLSEKEFNYAVQDKLHSGENQLRVRFIAQTEKAFLSKVVKVNNDDIPVEFELDKKTNVLTFSRETNYEIYDEFGMKVMSGTSNKVLLYRLSNKRYYLNLDNRNEELKLKR